MTQEIWKSYSFKNRFTLFDIQSIFLYNEGKGVGKYVKSLESDGV